MNFDMDFTENEHSFKMGLRDCIQSETPVILNVTFHENDCSFVTDFAEINKSFNVDFGEIQKVTELVGDPYKGSYEITPKVNAQIMPTRDKIMVDDLTVNAIQYAEVTNTSNGTTVTIA